MNKIHNWINTIALVVVFVLILVLVGSNQSVPPKQGGVTNFDALTLDNGDLTITNGGITLSTSGKSVSIPTGASATSTITVGRTQTYATSSATKICLDFNTQATTTIAGTANGVVTWQYGSCN